MPKAPFSWGKQPADQMKVFRGACVYVCMCVWLYVCARAWLEVCVCVCMYLHVYICVCFQFQARACACVRANMSVSPSRALRCAQTYEKVNPHKSTHTHTQI